MREKLPFVKWQHNVPVFFHYCGGHVWGFPLNHPPGWQWDEGSDTVTPSIHCALCRTEGHWTGGKWV